MAANTIGMNYEEVLRWIGREIGKDRDFNLWSAITLQDASDILKAGLRQFYWPPVLPGESTPHLWSFLEPTLAQLELHGSYVEGTVAITTGTVTLTGGTWPSWAAKGDLWVNGGYYPVVTRTNGTTLVLEDSSVTGLTGESYSLKQREYDLPDDFGGMVTPFTYRVDQSRGRPLTRVNDAMIRSMDNYPECSGPPDCFAITSVAPTSSEESRQVAVFAPLPDGDHVLWYRYSVVPPMMTEVTHQYAYGGAEVTETLLLSCLDKALQTLYGSTEKHAPFMESLAACVQRDRRVNRPKTHGFGAYSDGFDRESWPTRRPHSTEILTINL